MVCIHFLNQHKILDFLKPKMADCKKKKILLSEGPLLKFLDAKADLRIQHPK
jgi:hypothetical protein